MSRVLQVLTLAQDIGGDEHPQFVPGPKPVAPVIAVGAEPPGLGRGVGRLPGGAFRLAHPAGLELALEVADGIGELAEDEDLFHAVPGAQEPKESGQLGVAVRVPLAALLEDVEEGAGILQEVRRQALGEEPGAEPVKPAPVHPRVFRVDLGRPATKGLLGAQMHRFGHAALLVSVVETQLEPVGRVRVFVLHPGVQKVRSLGADGQRVALFHGVDEDEVAQDVSLDGEQERLAAALQALEEVGATKPHESLPGTGEVVQHPGLGGRGRAIGRSGHVVAEPVSRQVEIVDPGHHVVAIEASVLVLRVRIGDGEGHRLRQPDREVGAPAVFEGEVLAPVGRIGRRVVLLNEGPGAADHVQAHELAPVVGVLALLEGGQGAHRALVAAEELGLPEVAKEPLRADADFAVLGKEETKLVRQVVIGLVVGRGREQDHAAFVFLDVLLDRPVALALPVAQVVALVDDHEPVPAQLGKLAGRPGDGEDLGPQAVPVGIVLPHGHEVLGAEDEGLEPMVVLEHSSQGRGHEGLPQAHHITHENPAALVQVVRRHLDRSRLELEEQVAEIPGMRNSDSPARASWARWYAILR